MFDSFINKVISFISIDNTNTNWLRTFNEQELEGINNEKIKLLVRKAGIPDDLKRTVWPKLINLHELAYQEDNSKIIKERKHSRSLSTLLNCDILQVFQLNKSEANLVKGLLMCFRGEVHLIMQIILPFLVKYCSVDEVEELISRVNAPLESGGYYFYPRNTREILIFERIFEDLMSKFAPSIIKRITNIQLIIPEFAPEWEKLLFGFFLEIYPFSLITHIFDCFLVEGYKILLRFAIAHCILRQPKLLKATSPSTFTMELFRPKENCSEEFKKKFFDLAFGLNFSRSQVERYKNRHRKTSLGDIDKEDIRLLIHQTQKLPTLLQESLVCDDDHWRLLWKWVPNRFRILQVDLLFRKTIHGGSMTTMYEVCSAIEPLLLLVENLKGEKFGAFISKAFSNRPNRRKYLSPFFGTGETFIFKLSDPPSAHFYTATNNNSNFICADPCFLALGCSDGKFGIWIGDDLSLSSASPCKTFDGGFELPESEIKEVEIFKFV
jgi:TBC1 domain family member 24